MTQTHVGISVLVKNGIMLVVRTKFVMLTVITTLDRWLVEMRMLTLCWRQSYLLSRKTSTQELYLNLNVSELETIDIHFVPGDYSKYLKVSGHTFLMDQCQMSSSSFNINSVDSIPTLNKDHTSCLSSLPELRSVCVWRLSSLTVASPNTTSKSLGSWDKHSWPTQRCQKKWNRATVRHLARGYCISSLRSISILGWARSVY